MIPSAQMPRRTSGFCVKRGSSWVSGTMSGSSVDSACAQNDWSRGVSAIGSPTFALDRC